MLLRDRVYGILEPGDDDSKYFDPFIIFLICGNIIAVILDSVVWIHAQYGTILEGFEAISIIIFTIEYFLRVWSCKSNPTYSGSYGRLKYMLSVMAIVDLLAFLPFYLPLVFPELLFLRTLRLFRLLRIFKLARYSKSLILFKRVFEKTKDEIGFLSFCIVVLLILSSSMMYLAENTAQPDKFSSIPATMWWSVVTLTTVGYGDLTPVTDFGRMVGGISVFIGIVLVALLTGVMASGFTEVLAEKKFEE